ncbi:MAG: hypothetical protein JWM15_93 [Cryptosporangiaceae bacterium]|nr:hypothetical protein [Cryptosporangiaceae bacterium]
MEVIGLFGVGITSKGHRVMVSETHANGSRGRTEHTVGVDHSAPLEVLDAPKVADVDDRIRQATPALYPALLDADATAIGVAPTIGPIAG